MIATALVGIGTDFRSSPGATAGLISVLYLCSAVAQPTMGKLSVFFGPRRAFLSGVAVLLLAGVVGVLAPNLGVLLISRALIGVGTSACYPTAMALVRRRADESGVGVPGRVLGNFSIAAQVTAVVGLPLGGVLAGAFGWRALFAVNIPLALLAFTLTLRGVAKDAPVRKQGLASLLTMLDLPGIALFAGAIISLLVFLSALTTPAWWLAVLAVVLAGALLLRERHARSPLIDVRMLGRNGPLQRTYLRTILAALATYASMYGASQWMEQSMRLNRSGVGPLAVDPCRRRFDPLRRGDAAGEPQLRRRTAHRDDPADGPDQRFQQFRQSGSAVPANDGRGDRRGLGLAADVDVLGRDRLLQPHQHRLWVVRHRRRFPHLGLDSGRHWSIHGAPDGV
ncbi:MFS transporter [Arthrobacter sp. KNU40]